MDKYYIYKDGEYFDEIGYDSFDEALEITEEFDCDEIECHSWEDEENYNNYEPSSKQKLVWKKGE